MEEKSIAAFGAADAGVTSVHTGLTIWRTVLTQLSGEVCKGARGTLCHARTILVQKKSFETRRTIQSLWAEAGLTGCVACVTFTFLTIKVLSQWAVNLRALSVERKIPSKAKVTVC